MRATCQIDKSIVLVISQWMEMERRSSSCDHSPLRPWPRRILAVHTLCEPKPAPTYMEFPVNFHYYSSVNASTSESCKSESICDINGRLSTNERPFGANFSGFTTTFNRYIVLAPLWVLLELKVKKKTMTKRFKHFCSLSLLIYF